MGIPSCPVQGTLALSDVTDFASDNGETDWGACGADGVAQADEFSEDEGDDATVRAFRSPTVDEKARAVGHCVVGAGGKAKLVLLRFVEVYGVFAARDRPPFRVFGVASANEPGIVGDLGVDDARSLAAGATAGDSFYLEVNPAHGANQEFVDDQVEEVIISHIW